MNPGQDVQQHCGQSDTTDSMNQPLMSQQQRPRTLMTEQSPASETSRASSATNASQSSTPESPNPDTATPIQDHAPPSLPQATTTNMTQTQTRQPVGPQPPGGPDAYLQFMNMSQSATLAPSPSPTPQHSGGLHFIYDHHCDFVQFNVLNPLAVFVGPAYVKGWVIHINTKGEVNIRPAPGTCVTSVSDYFLPSPYTKRPTPLPKTEGVCGYVFWMNEAVDLAYQKKMFGRRVSVMVEAMLKINHDIGRPEVQMRECRTYHDPRNTSDGMKSVVLDDQERVLWQDGLMRMSLCQFPGWWIRYIALLITGSPTLAEPLFIHPFPQSRAKSLSLHRPHPTRKDISDFDAPQARLSDAVEHALAAGEGLELGVDPGSCDGTACERPRSFDVDEESEESDYVYPQMEEEVMPAAMKLNRLSERARRVQQEDSHGYHYNRRSVKSAEEKSREEEEEEGGGREEGGREGGEAAVAGSHRATSEEQMARWMTAEKIRRSQEAAFGTSAPQMAGQGAAGDWRKSGGGRKGVVMVKKRVSSGLRKETKK